MKKCPVTDSNVVADVQCIAPRVVRAIVGNVQYRAILNIGSRANANNLDISAHGGVGPNAGIVTEMNIAHDYRGRVNHDAITENRGYTQHLSDI